MCLAPPCMCTKWLVCLHTRIWSWDPAVSQLPCSSKPMQARKIISCPFPLPLFDCRVESYFATIASAVKAQNTWPWHQHMCRGSYLSRLDFSKVSSASTHAHKSPEPRCYLPTTHTRANKGSHPGPNQNPNFFQERCTTQSPHNYHTGTAWKKPGKGAMARKKTHIELLSLLLLLSCESCPCSVSPI